LKEDILSAFDHYLSFTFWKFVTDAIRYCVSGLWRYFVSAGMEKGIKYSQDQSSILLLFEHNFRYNAEVLRLTLQRIIGCLLPLGVLNRVMLYLNYLFSKYLLIVKRFGSVRERRYISIYYYYYNAQIF